MSVQIRGIDFKIYAKRCLIHFPVGIVIAIALSVNSILGIIIALYFMVYQLNEDKNIRDFAYPDLAGTIWGMAVYALIEKAISLLR